MKVFELTEQVKHDLLPGVVAVDSLADWFWDHLYSTGTNLSADDWKIEFEKEHGREPESEDWDSYYADEEEWVFGDWYDVHEKGGIVNWVPGNQGDYSAIVQWLRGAPLVTVVAGKYYTTVRSMCSPCCPARADLDSGYQEGGYACYSLPSEFYREEK